MVAGWKFSSIVILKKIEWDKKFLVPLHNTIFKLGFSAFKNTINYCVSFDLVSLISTVCKFVKPINKRTRSLVPFISHFQELVTNVPGTLSLVGEHVFVVGPISADNCNVNNSYMFTLFDMTLSTKSSCKLKKITACVLWYCKNTVILGLRATPP